MRNSVGFDWHPVTKHLYFTDNGRDWLSEDLPEDELNRVTKIGQHFGFPYCHQGDFTDREMGWGRSCDEFEKPVAKLGPHSAALGMRFYTGNMFPQRIAAASSSRGTAPGTAPRRSAATWCTPRSTATAPCAR